MQLSRAKPGNPASRYISMLQLSRAKLGNPASSIIFLAAPSLCVCVCTPLFPRHDRQQGVPQVGILGGKN